MIERRVARIALFELALAAMVAVAACSDGGDRFPAPSNPATEDGGGHQINPTPSTACIGNHTRTCRIALPKQGSVTSCFEGVQECADGGWGDCVDPATIDVTDQP